MIDLPIAAAGLLVGFVVGLTGMGGGALMTPLLVLLFKIQPLAAVSSDIVAAMVMKPVGGSVHWRRGSVNTGLVKWLIVGSVPSAFLGVVLLQYAGQGQDVQQYIKVALGIALLIVALGLVLRPLLIRQRLAGDPAQPIVVKKLPTVLIGVAGGLVVGITSVGSGSLMIILLLILYPRLRLAELVGTDLVQAIPLVASAAIGHLLFGDFQLALTASILIGSVPGVFLGAQLSSRASDGFIRPVLIVVLLASGLKLLAVSTWVVGAMIVAVLVPFGVVLAIRHVVRIRADSQIQA